MNFSRVYQHFNPGKLIFGPKALVELGKEISPKEIPLIVTDQGVLKAGIVKKTEKTLTEMDIKFHVFDKIVMDPPIEVIEKASNYYKANNCTMVIGLGGGSCMDAAKAISICVSQTSNLRDYARGKVLEGVLAPICAIPTTAGTGSEVTGVAVISDPENNQKMAIKGNTLTPIKVILDPELLMSLPAKVAAETGADALVHAIEVFISKNANPITDALAIASIGIIGQNLRKMISKTRDLETASNMLIGSCMAGLAFSNGGLGLVHSLAHPLGAYYHVGHGFACGIYLIPVMEFNKSVCLSKYSEIACALGENVHGISSDEAAQKAIIAVKNLLRDIGFPDKISEILEEFVVKDQMVEDAFVAGPTTVNPRKATKKQIRELFNSIK